MQRLAASIAGLLVLLTAALVPGAAVSRALHACDPGADEAALVAHVTESSLVVVGEVAARTPVDTSSEGAVLDLQPEAFLKGNVTAGVIRFRVGAPDVCADPAHEPKAGDRLLVIAQPGDSSVWPGPGRVFSLSEGTATSYVRGGSASLAEDELTRIIRRQTNQFAVPARSASEGQGIDWVRTVIPVGGATLLILAVSLYLMRIWHRIDPS